MCEFFCVHILIVVFKFLSSIIFKTDILIIAGCKAFDPDCEIPGQEVRGCPEENMICLSIDSNFDGGEDLEDGGFFFSLSLFSPLLFFRNSLNLFEPSFSSNLLQLQKKKQ